MTCHSVKSRIALFADDTYLYKSIKTEEDVAALQNDIDQLVHWEKLTNVFYFLFPTSARSCKENTASSASNSNLWTVPNTLVSLYPKTLAGKKHVYI